VSNTALVNTLCIVEVAVAIMIASSALLRPVFDHITRGVRSLTHNDISLSQTQKSRRSVMHKSFHETTSDDASQGDKPLEPAMRLVTEIYSGDGEDSEDRSLEDGHIYVATTTKIT
jgi:hypothetical protein